MKVNIDILKKYSIEDISTIDFDKYRPYLITFDTTNIPLEYVPEFIKPLSKFMSDNSIKCIFVPKQYIEVYKLGDNDE